MRERPIRRGRIAVGLPESRFAQWHSPGRQSIRPMTYNTLQHGENTFRDVRAIFVWPWNENARTKQKQQANGNRAIWLVYRTDTNAPGFWLVKRRLGWKTFIPEELSRNRFDVILQRGWPIEQYPLHIRVFFGAKTKSPCLVLFIHWLIKQITLTETIFQGHTKIALF